VLIWSCRLLGVAGAAALAIGAATAGALPVRDPVAAVAGLRELRGFPGLGVVCAYAGLVLLVAAWWGLGRLVAGDDPPDTRALLVTLAGWAAPLAVAPPLFSRDVYSYLAQGAMVAADLDVYRYGPAALGGPLALDVAAVWQQAPTPYGPMFLLCATGVAALAGSHAVAGVLGLRLVALAGVGLLAMLLPGLARRCGVAPAAALWLGVLNPLVLIHLVSGAHNDALMLGLLVAGLTVTLVRHPAIGAAVVALAALVKAPAALGLLVVASVWAGRLTGPGRQVRAGCGVAAISLGVVAAVTAVTGTGYGWLSALRTPVSAHNWSLSSTVGRLTRTLLEAVGAGGAGYAVAAWRWVGLAAAMAAGAWIWRRRDAVGPVYALGLALGALVVFGPAFRPWYLLWGLIPLAASAPDGPVRRWAAVASGGLALVVLPSGYTPTLTELGQAGLGIGIAVAGLAVARRPQILAAARRPQILAVARRPRILAVARRPRILAVARRPWLRAAGWRPWTLAGLAAGTGLFIALVPGHRGWFDASVYYGAVHHWLAGGDLYDYLRPASRYGFTYPPFAALTMAPMLLVGWHTAVGIGVALSVVAAATVVIPLVLPVIRRYGWPRWYALGTVACLVALLEPVRDTVSFGQVNLALLALVTIDAQALRTGRSRWAGVGIGLAAAIKLTPAIFIGYLLVTRRWRAAAVASGTAAVATLVAAAVAPHASLVFWTEALWRTGRVGDVAYVSNQSVLGAISRLDLGASGRVAWVLAVAAILAVWIRRVRAAPGDPVAGFALTGVVACLVSPITWVHHLVWTLPALILLGDAGLRALPRRRPLALAAVAYVLLCSSLVWLWSDDPGGVLGVLGVLGGNAYGWLCLALLLRLPIARTGLGTCAAATRAGVGAAGDVGQREPVAIDSQPADHAGGDRRDDRVVPELLPRVNVGDVDLDQRSTQQGAGVP
jgi:hypothetical protein